MKTAILSFDFKINNAEAKVKKEDLVYAKVTFSGWFAGEFVKTLQVDTPLVPSHKHLRILLLQFVLLEIQTDIAERLMELLFVIQLVFYILRIFKCF